MAPVVIAPDGHGKPNTLPGWAQPLKPGDQPKITPYDAPDATVYDGSDSAA
jgi:hypothetical protein